MTVEKKIEAFEKMAVTAAEEKKRQVASEMESRFNAMIDAEVREEEQKSNATVRSERYRIEREKNKNIVNNSSRAKRDFIAWRERLTAGLFDDVLNDIKNFVASAGYEKFLLEKIKSAAQNGQYETVQLTVTDMRYAAAVTSASGLAVESALEDFIGGFKLIGPGRRSIADHTLLGKFNEQRANFSMIATQ